MKLPLILLLFFLVLAINSWSATEKVLYSFTNASDGGYPIDYGHLARDSSGALYGTTGGGGACQNGAVFKLIPSVGGHWQEETLHSFCDNDGVNPNGDVVLDSSGNIYGTTQGGYPPCRVSCGTVFKLDTSGNFSLLYTFTGGNDGANPFSGVILDAKGNLYGTTYAGGPSDNGVVYEISSAGTFSVIYTFCTLSNCIDGADSLSGLAIDNQGRLYGMTYTGGAYGDGVLFELYQSGGHWQETVLHSFAGGPTDGQGPNGSSPTLATRTVGTRKQFVILGATAYGGASGYDGTVFGMAETEQGYAYELLYSFTGTNGDGQQPYGSLVVSHGRIFGTTEIGGTTNGGVLCLGSGCGTVFELTPKGAGWTETIVHEFMDTDGASPLSGLIADSDGNLFGVAYSGGGNSCNGEGCGAVYEIVP